VPGPRAPVEVITSLLHPSSYQGLHKDPQPKEPAYHSKGRRGKALPIEYVSGEDPSILLQDWLPSLKQAADWNGWTPQDKIMQLPEYLKGRSSCRCPAALTGSNQPNHGRTRVLALLAMPRGEHIELLLMHGPAVSGSRSYQELCAAAKEEEHRLAALQQYQQLKPKSESQRRPRRQENGQSHPHGPT